MVPFSRGLIAAFPRVGIGIQKIVRGRPNRIGSFQNNIESRNSLWIQIFAKTAPPI